MPTITRVGVLWRSENRSLLDWSLTAARLEGLEIMAIRIDGAADIDAAFEAAHRNRLDAVITTQGALFLIEGTRIAQLGLKHKLPTMTGEPGFASAGGFLQFGPDIAQNWRRAASYVHRILEGEKPGDMPIEQPYPKLALDLKTAKALGLTVPTAIVLRADEVIE